MSKAQRALPAAESDTVQLVSKAQRALPPGESDTVQAVSPTSWASLGAAYATSDSVGINSPTADLLATLFPPADPGPHAPPPHPGAPSPGPGPAAAAPAADFTGVTFSLTSQLTGEVHQLQIENQVNPPEVRPQAPDGADGGAARLPVPGEAQGAITFTALWDLGAAGESPATGTLSPDGAGNFHIRFTWGSVEAGTLHVFDGTITGEAGSYHIEGTATARPDGVSDPLAGDQRAHHDSPYHDPAPAGGQAPAAPAAPAVKQVADLTGAGFALTDDNGGAHQLQIQAQAAQPDGSATFTAVWDGQAVTGTLAYDAAGNVHAGWAGADGSGFDGTITGAAGTYHLDGNATGADGTTVHAAGDQGVPAAPAVSDFTNVSFALTDDNGTAHQLQIQAQAAQPDGSAAFTALWDGQGVSGTLAYDANGNVHITWSGADGSGFDATITSTAGAYHLDGNLTGADGTTIHAAGDQSA